MSLLYKGMSPPTQQARGGDEGAAQSGWSLGTTVSMCKGEVKKVEPARDQGLGRDSALPSARSHRTHSKR